GVGPGAAGGARAGAAALGPPPRAPPRGALGRHRPPPAGGPRGRPPLAPCGACSSAGGGAGARPPGSAARGPRPPPPTPRVPPRLSGAPGTRGGPAAGECVPIPAAPVPELLALAERLRVDLVVVGPEGPLALGLADGLAARGIPVFGPTRAAAALESSK